MSRARNIKPGFFKNDLLAECSPLARILFIGLWCEADREGRLENRPRRIKAECLPYDDCDVSTLLDELSERGFITCYEDGESHYIAIPEFSKHQNPHVKEQASQIPAPCMPGASTVQVQGLSGESMEVATLIPDSLLLIPDSPSPPDAAASSPASSVLDTYHRILPKCQHISVLNDKRKKRIAAAVKLAKSVCADQGWPYEPSGFWSAYFHECAKDAWMRGEVANPKNLNWKQNLDVLIAEDRFAGVMDGAISAMRSRA
jgi:hypothetical protein